MRIETTRLEWRTDEGVSLSDITADVNALIRDAGIRTGLCILTLSADGCCLTLSPDLDEDVDDLLRLARTHLTSASPATPESVPERPGDRVEVDDAGYLPAGVLADCLSLTIRDGSLNVGSWDAVVVLDGRGPLLRPVDVTLIGS